MAPHVTYLCYEADTLPAYEEMEDWECNLSDPGFFSNLELMDPASSDSSSECADRAYERELSPLTELKSTRYHKFLNYRKQQDAMREDDYYAGKVVDAMSRLPNLEAIIFSLEHWAGLPSQAIKNAYSDSLVVPYGHNSWKDPRGVPQMLSLLQGSAHNQIKLKVLHGGVMDWKFFKQSDEVFKDLQKAVRNVQELKLEFSTSPGMEEARDLLRNFDDERLQEFLAAAPNLEMLDLRFDSAIPSSIRGYPADLSYVVGMHKWEFLADVTLSFFSSRAEDLVGFCEIHDRTMQRLAISKIILVEGSWLSTFQKMRRLLHLKEVRIRGRLEALNECWTFAMMKTRGETTMSRVVQEYLLQGGDGPLLDLEQYTDLSKDELKELKDLRWFYDSAWP
ncbi:hypothetical protein MMC22_004382 [Lobaria immixta]|nr:hypothetical protein [Lobaria immixta]